MLVDYIGEVIRRMGQNFPMLYPLTHYCSSNKKRAFKKKPSFGTPPTPERCVDGFKSISNTIEHANTPMF